MITLGTHGKYFRRCKNVYLCVISQINTKLLNITVEWYLYVRVFEGRIEKQAHLSVYLTLCAAATPQATEPVACAVLGHNPRVRFILQRNLYFFTSFVSRFIEQLLPRCHTKWTCINHVSVSEFLVYLSITSAHITILHIWGKCKHHNFLFHVQQVNAYELYS